MSKTALITGAGSGIGAACAKELALAGFRIAAHYNSDEAGALRLLEEIGDPDSFALGAELGSVEAIDQLAKEVKDRGGVDVLVNNAGIAIDAPLFNAKVDDFDRVVDVNMRATWLLTKRIGRMMMRKKAGRIINISSVIGSTGNPAQSVYGMTKAAIDNLTRTAAMELAHFGILVNAVAPGFIETPMTKKLSDDVRGAIMERIALKRMGTPQEVAKAVRFLAVDGDYCTGTVLHLNGGMY